MDTTLKDFELVKNAGFTPDIALVANAAISSLHYLKALSVKLGVPMEQITAEHIVRVLSQALVEGGGKAIDITERYKVIFAEHHYASDYRVKLFTGWCAIYAGLAVAFAWADKTSKPLTWVVTAAAAAVTILMWSADFRHRSGLRASKDAGAAIEQDSTAAIPPDQRFFTRFTAVTCFEKFMTHSWAINIFSAAMTAVLLYGTWYLCSHKGVLPQ